MLGLSAVLAFFDVAEATGLGSYTALASLGVVGVIGTLCLYMVMHTIPNERKAERETLEKINKSHDEALALLSQSLHTSIRESGTLFATTLREYREEQSRRDDAERASRDSMLRASEQKVDRLAHSFQALALRLGDVMQSLAIPDHASGILRRTPQPKQKESVLE